MSLNAVIIEDSHENIETLSLLLNSSQHDITILETADNLTDAKNLLIKRSNEIDIAFLDIQLKEGVIFSILEDISLHSSIAYEVVFVTAHSSFEYATKAIGFACLDYITKPIDSNQLNATIEKALERKQKNNSSFDQVKYLLNVLQSNVSQPTSISVSLPKGVIEIIELNDITHLKADENTCIFYFNKGGSIHSNKSFAHYIDLLRSHNEFIQVSRNSMVNKPAIKRYNHREKTILLKNNAHIIVSHRYAKNFKEELDNSKEGGFLDGLKGLFGS